MIADDDTVLTDFICLALADLGYTTVTASDGLQALALVEREQPALALLDMGMPHLGGRELAVRIHDATGGTVPCVVMSGSADLPTDDGDGIIAGYLPKPFELDELIAVV